LQIASSVFWSGLSLVWNRLDGCVLERDGLVAVGNFNVDIEAVK
jgi:hypothetical protein